MSFTRNLFQVHVVIELHVACVDAHDFEPAHLIGHPNIHLSVKAAKAAQSRVDTVGAVSGAHNDHVAAGLEAVHERQQLQHHVALLNFRFRATISRFGCCN